MSAPSPHQDYTLLTCTECPSTEFLPTHRKRWKAGSGIVEEPAGAVCAQCQARVDNAVLIERAKLHAKRRELAAQAEELAELEATRTPGRREPAKA